MRSACGAVVVVPPDGNRPAATQGQRRNLNPHFCIDAGGISAYDAPKWSKVVGSGE